MKRFTSSNSCNSHIILKERDKMIIHVNLLITLFHFLITNNLISKTYPLEHELTRIEEFCELPSKSWNGCPQNTLQGWENYNKRLQRWYQFINQDQIHLDYLSFLRYKLKNDDSDDLQEPDFLTSPKESLFFFDA